MNARNWRVRQVRCDQLSDVYVHGPQLQTKHQAMHVQPAASFPDTCSSLSTLSYSLATHYLKLKTHRRNDVLRTKQKVADTGDATSNLTTFVVLADLPLELSTFTE